MKKPFSSALFVVFLLSACYSRHPEIPLVPRPPEPLLQALEHHRSEFVSLKGIATAEIRKRGGRKAFDTVGVVIDGRDRIRIEAYGPLGQSLAAIVWNGRNLLLRMPNDENVTTAGPERLERLLGRGVDPSELCAVLSGNIPDPGPGTQIKLLCSGGNDCTLEMRSGETLRRVLVTIPSDGSEPRVRSYERYRSGGLLFSAGFADTVNVKGYSLPMRIVLESPADHAGMTILYSDVDVNVPLEQDSFSLEEDAPGQELR